MSLKDDSRLDDGYVATGTIAKIDPFPNKFVLSGKNGMLVSINMADGTLMYGDQYVPEEAAEIFWANILREYNEFLEWKKNGKNRTDY